MQYAKSPVKGRMFLSVLKDAKVIPLIIFWVSVNVVNLNPLWEWPTECLFTKLNVFAFERHSVSFLKCKNYAILRDGGTSAFETAAG